LSRLKKLNFEVMEVLCEDDKRLFSDRGEKHVLFRSANRAEFVLRNRLLKSWSG